jgi:hypothetical protein
MSNTRQGISLASGFVLSLGIWLLSATPADAVVYCKQAGVPKGCVARPGAGAGTPGVGVASGVGAGAPGVGAGAPGVGVAPANRGGPVNRRGVR